MSNEKPSPCPSPKPCRPKHFFWTPLMKIASPIKPYFLGALSGICATCCI